MALEKQKQPHQKTGERMNKMPMRISHDHVLKWSHEGKSYCLHTQIDDEAGDSPLSGDTLVSVLSAHPDIKGNVETESIKDYYDYWQETVKHRFSDDEIIELLKAGECPNAKLAEMPDGLYHCHGTDRYGQEFCKDNLKKEDIKNLIGDIMGHESAIKLLSKTRLILPLWSYEHSGITLHAGQRTYPFNDQFDSSMIGWAFIKKWAVFENFPNITENNWAEKANEIITSTIEALNQWLDNDIWWFQLLVWNKEDGGWEELDSCGGFYGSNLETNGMPDHVGHGLSEAIKRNTVTEDEVKYVTVQYFGDPK